MGDLGKGFSQVAGAVVDPFNLSGYGGVPGVNSNGRTLTDLGNDIKGDVTGQRATDNALAAQNAGAAAATSTLSGVYNDQVKTLNPYNQVGLNALSGLQDPSLQRNFSMSDFQADPGYQFQLAEGNKAINAAAAARGMGNSGATMKALTAYGQNVANQSYQQAFDRYNTNRTTNFNMLSGLAGVGQNAANSQVNAGGNYGNAIAGVQTGLANANASAQIAQANRSSNLIGQAVGGGIAAFSDERLKTDIEPVSPEELQEMKKHLQAFAFKYKSDEFGKGDWVGVMAQDLEKSKLGRTLVIEDENGNKTIDLRKVLCMFLATLAEA